MSDQERIERLERIVRNLMNTMLYNLDDLDKRWVKQELDAMLKELQQ